MQKLTPVLQAKEFQAALTHLKTGKAPGVDGIDADMLKVDPELAAGYCSL